MTSVQGEGRSSKNKMDSRVHLNSVTAYVNTCSLFRETCFLGSSFPND